MRTLTIPSIIRIVKGLNGSSGDGKLGSMVIFLAGAVPLSCAFVVFGYVVRSESIFTLGRPAARGFLMFILSYLFYLLLRPVVQLEYTASGIYLYYLFHEYLYFLVWGVVSYLIYYQVPHTDDPEGESLLALVYFGAFYSLLAISDILLNKTLTAYVLFFLPLCRVGMIFIAVSSILLARRMYMLIRYALILLPFGAAAAGAMVPSLFIQKHLAGSILVSIGLFVAGGTMFFFSSRK